MGWKEIEQKLMLNNESWFIDEKDPDQWESLIKIIHTEFPDQSHHEIRTAVLHAKQSLLPPVAKSRVVEWVKLAMQEPPKLK